MNWSISDSRDLYNIELWGEGYFRISEKGQVEVITGEGEAVDLKALTEQMRSRGVDTPILFRFPQILSSRIEQLTSAFTEAARKFQFGGSYLGVYPIKVNQARQIVEEIVTSGANSHYGLEAGSKAEMFAITTLIRDPDALVICNGYKDEDYVVAALQASRLGPAVILVVENLSELEVIKTVSDRLGIRPLLGLRAKLASRGSGLWESSGGFRSKYGLTMPQLLECLEFLRREDMTDTLCLLHYHIGSQITSIEPVRDALREAVRLYSELRALGAPLRYLDVGGGLGVDYDGSHTDAAASVNYSLQDYADALVEIAAEEFDGADIPPTLVTEAGRSLVAYNSVLVVDVVGAEEMDFPPPPDRISSDAPEVVLGLLEMLRRIEAGATGISYDDALELLGQAQDAFLARRIGLTDRALVERIFWTICDHLLRLLQESGDDTATDPRLAHLEAMVSDIYLCNFSMFRSLPDTWAIGQLFPVMPLQRLNEMPSVRAELADITCDSDGKISRFIHTGREKTVLELHDLREQETYDLGFFLVGAYQEILGDLHNLFGDVHIVQVRAGPETHEIESVIPGATVEDVLRVVSYEREQMIDNLRAGAARALEEGRIDPEQVEEIVDHFTDGLEAYTYLVNN